jgi:hypothetical protein
MMNINASDKRSVRLVDTGRTEAEEKYLEITLKNSPDGPFRTELSIPARVYASVSGIPETFHEPVQLPSELWVYLCDPEDIVEEDIADVLITEGDSSDNPYRVTVRVIYYLNTPDTVIRLPYQKLREEYLETKVLEYAEQNLFDIISPGVIQYHADYYGEGENPAGYEWALWVDGVLHKYDSTRNTALRKELDKRLFKAVREARAGQTDPCPDPPGKFKEVPPDALKIVCTDNGWQIQ